MEIQPDKARAHDSTGISLAGVAATGTPTLRVVVVDDDAVLRGVIGELLVEAPFELAGQAESPELGFDEVVRAQADVVILDLALRSGHGEHLLARLQEERPETRVVVFSAYVSDAMRLLDAGAVAVVEKPDFNRLEEVLATVALEADGRHVDKRRAAPRDMPGLPAPTGITLSGLEPWRSFRSAVEGLYPGDAILAFDVLPTPGLRAVWDDVYRMDYRLAIGRAAARTGREQDRVSLTPQGLPVMLIVAGHPEAPGAVYDRIRSVWDREVAAGLPVAAFGHVLRDAPPSTILDRVVAKLLNDVFDEIRPLHLV